MIDDYTKDLIAVNTALIDQADAWLRDYRQAREHSMAATPTTNDTTQVAVETRPGWRTTEFWVMVLALLATTVQQAVGIFNITDARVLLIQSIVVGAYSLSRGLAKAGVPNAIPAQPVVTTTSSAPTSEVT